MNYYDEEENNNYKKELVVAIAPYLQQINSLQDVITKQNSQSNDDFEKIIECVDELAKQEKISKDDVFRSYYYETQFLLKKYQKKIEQFKFLLMEYKILDHEEIMQQ